MAYGKKKKAGRKMPPGLLKKLGKKVSKKTAKKAMGKGMKRRG